VIECKKIVQGEAAPGQQVLVKWKYGKKYYANVVELGRQKLKLAT